ncbi:MAG: DUF3027 domain-containing protein, partial [Actinomycetes bacterium]
PAEPLPAESVLADPVSAESVAPVAAPVARRRAVRKPSKPDAVLAAAVETARRGVLEIAGDAAVGEHLGAFPEAERLVTHRFAAQVPGYVGWHWFATLARVPRGKDATVCEVGLLPSEDALLAPDWVPWSERVRPEDTAAEEAAQTADAGTAQASDDSGAPEADGATDTDDATDEDGTPDAPSSEDPETPGDQSPIA